MKLHTNIKLFDETIWAASNSTGIKVEFVEKDYWITLVLSLFSKSEYTGHLYTTNCKFPLLFYNIVQYIYLYTFREH